MLSMAHTHTFNWTKEPLKVDQLQLLCGVSGSPANCLLELLRIARSNCWSFFRSISGRVSKVRPPPDIGHCVWHLANWGQPHCLPACPSVCLSNSGLSNSGLSNSGLSSSGLSSSNLSVWMYLWLTVACGLVLKVTLKGSEHYCGHYWPLLLLLLLRLCGVVWPGERHLSVVISWPKCVRYFSFLARYLPYWLLLGNFVI